MLYKKDNPLAFFLVFGILVLILAILPFFMELFFQTFITEILIWVLFAISFDLIFGYTGLLSFGQALFFGVGGYTIAILILKAGWSAGYSLLLAVLVPIVFAWFVGYFSVKLTGIHFVIITLIFALIGSTIGETWSVTGGADGLVFPVTPLQFGLFQVDLMDIRSNYYFVLVLAALSYLMLRRIVQSPLGKVFISIRENEDRAQLIGYNVQRYKLLAFVIAGGFSGLAGGLYSLTLKYASANFLHWSVSGHAVVYTIVGGMGTLIGPVIGTGIIMSLEHYLIKLFEGTELIIGIVLVIMVILAPQGLIGILKRKGK